MNTAPIASIVTVVATLLLGSALGGNAANAGPITCGTTIVLPGGNGYVLNSALGAGVCVQTSNATFGNFVISSLPVAGRVAFNLTNFGVPPVAYSGVSFNNNFAAGNIYIAGYSVEITDGPNLFKSINGDFTQNDGVSSLLGTTSQPGTGSIHWTKVGASGSGPDQINYNLGFARLDITNTLTDNGSVSAISNNLVQNATVIAEPASLALLGSGLMGLSVFVRRSRRASGTSGLANGA